MSHGARGKEEPVISEIRVKTKKIYVDAEAPIRTQHSRQRHPVCRAVSVCAVIVCAVIVCAVIVCDVTVCAVIVCAVTVCAVIVRATPSQHTRIRPMM